MVQRLILTVALATVLGCSSSSPALGVDGGIDGGGGDGDGDADADGDGDSDADGDGDSDADGDGDTDADGDADGDADEDCRVGCEFATDCGGLANHVEECLERCDSGEVPLSLAACLADAARNDDCATWRLCFEPTDGDFCDPWCAFAAECEFSTEEECLDRCTSEPPPNAVADCLEPTIDAADCRAAVECFFEPLPEGFCEDLCVRADECEFLGEQTVDECVAGCGPVAPPELVECVLDALDATCLDLAGCFRDIGPTEEQCEDVCALRAECHDWGPDEIAVCETECADNVQFGFAPCVERAEECEAADACFGDLNEPPEGYCDEACAFELDPCGLITEGEVEPCVTFCAAGGQSDEFYSCRQEAIGIADCDAYLECGG
ncbi:MAG: hypothetical protein HYY06_18360 [Deltaproteobacteria bacterium]|nr:hypothetical protein [Deltaproteobacteria bacterium]